MDECDTRVLPPLKSYYDHTNYLNLSEIK